VEYGAQTWRTADSSAARYALGGVEARRRRSLKYLFTAAEDIAASVISGK